MDILGRLKNAYASGGLKEIARKAFFHYVYRINNYKTRFIVNHSCLEYGLNKTQQRSEKIVISLTSFTPRFEKIHLCLKSLLLQSVKPDRIIVYLGSDSSKDAFTKEMIELEKYGIEYRLDENKNIRSHMKYIFAMQEFPNDLIVTADDDIYYPSNWLKSLLDSHKRYPKAICARRVHRMKKNDSELASYNSWEDQCRSILEPCNELLATGVGGVLYPPHCLDARAFDESKIRELSFEADDIWLKCMEILNKTPVVWTKNWEVDLLPVEKIQKAALSNQNVDFCKNDVFLNNVMNHYSISINAFFE